MRKIKIEIPTAMYEALKEIGDPDEVVEEALRRKLEDMNQYIKHT